jgi:hypothetical protein
VIAMGYARIRGGKHEPNRVRLGSFGKKRGGWVRLVRFVFFEAAEFSWVRFVAVMPGDLSIRAFLSSANLNPGGSQYDLRQPGAS